MPVILTQPESPLARAGIPRFRPWRSARIGYTVALVALIVGVPLFLAMPPWNDVTLYDVAARNILRGGVHYRDVFDTNLPGIDWIMAGVRFVFGWSYEALRAFDLIVVGTTCALLRSWIRNAGGTAASAAWFIAGMALFYPFTSEFCHCQRDPWMLLPAVIAARLRLRAVYAARFRTSVLEGFIWGLAVWIKPHVLIPAACVWLTSLVLATHRNRAVDLLGLLIGGVLAGIPGVIWLHESGAWPYFLDIFTNWNPEYTAQTWSELPQRLRNGLDFFPPLGLVHLAALPLAVHNLWRSRKNPNPEYTSSALLSALYLGWLAQAVIIQRGFDYARLPDTILALTVISSRGWSVGCVYLAWIVVVGGLLNLIDVIPGATPLVRAIEPNVRCLRFEKHAMLDPAVLELWPRCWREGGSPELRDKLGWYVNVHCGTKWTDLEGVAGYLRTVEPPLRDRELTCWHDSTHPLYLMLDVKPSTRYMHFGTVFPLRGKVDEIRLEVADSPQRYVVSDLRRMTYSLDEAYAPGMDGPNSLPAWFPRSQCDQFPWDQPIVFRSGRYLVHRVAHPPRPEMIDIPDWNTLDDLGPGIGDLMHKKWRTGWRDPD